MTTEQADFEVSVDTSRSWRDLIRDNPFDAKKKAPQAEPSERESLMMLAEPAPAQIQEPVNSGNEQPFSVVFEYGDKGNDFADELSRSDKFAQRVVSLGPHDYIDRAEGLDSAA